MIIFGAILSGCLFASLISFADSLAVWVLEIWFSPKRKQIVHKWKTLLLARSRCDVCRQPIAPLYLIPLLGFFLAGRKCASCAALIPLRHPILETIFFIYGAVLFVISPLSALAVALSLPALVLLAVVDYRYYLLPDLPLAWLLFLALAEFFLLRGDVFALESGRLLQPRAMLDIAVPFSWFLLFHLLRILSGGRLGFADATLVLALGIGLGYRAALFLPTLAAFLAIGVYAFQRFTLAKRAVKFRKIAFAPYLIVAALILRFWS